MIAMETRKNTNGDAMVFMALMFLCRFLLFGMCMFLCILNVWQGSCQAKSGQEKFCCLHKKEQRQSR
jgi:hypothetical protein